MDEGPQLEKLSRQMNKLKQLILLAESLLPSRLRCMLMRWRGAVIGRGVKLGMLSLFKCGRIKLGDHCEIGAFTRFKISDELDFEEGVKVGPFTRLTGRRIALGSETTVGAQVLIAGAGRHGVMVCGPRCYIGDRTYIDLTRSVTAGIEVGFGGASLIFTHGSWQSELEGFPVTAGSIEIGDFAWLGWNVTLLSGVKIGEFALVSAGSVVRSDVAAYSLVSGNPARGMLPPFKHMKSLTPEDRFAICRGVLEDLAAHQEWLGSKVKATLAETECRVEVNGETILLSPAVTTPLPAQAVVSLARMSDDTILAMEAAGRDWFDIARRRCSRPRFAVHAMLRSFFSQRGVRFQLTDRGSIATAADVKMPQMPPLA